MATYFENEITSRGGTVLLSVSNFSAKTQNELIEYYTKFAHVDGIIAIEPSGKIKNNSAVPIIQIGDDNGLKNVDCVRTDIGDAIDEAIRLLIHNSHEKIGFIGERLADKEYGYFKAIMEKKRLKIHEELVIISERRFYDAGYFAMAEMLEKNTVPTAIIAAYSHIAAGILQKLKESGKQIPEYLSLVCLDDITSVPYSDIRLSCIKMHLDELCAVAIDLLYRKIENSYITTRQVISVKREFVREESVARARE